MPACPAWGPPPCGAWGLLASLALRAGARNSPSARVQEGFATAQPSWGFPGISPSARNLFFFFALQFKTTERSWQSFGHAEGIGDKSREFIKPRDRREPRGPQPSRGLAALLPSSIPKIPGHPNQMPVLSCLDVALSIWGDGSPPRDCVLRSLLLPVGPGHP